MTARNERPRGLPQGRRDLAREVWNILARRTDVGEGEWSSCGVPWARGRGGLGSHCPLCGSPRPESQVVVTLSDDSEARLTLSELAAELLQVVGA